MTQTRAFQESNNVPQSSPVEAFADMIVMIVLCELVRHTELAATPPLLVIVRQVLADATRRVARGIQTRMG